MTGKYFDYLCNFKRNPELSDAAREEVAGYFKKCPSTRDKFVRDYRLWMTYEQEGIQKLNKVTRKIFFNFVPFPRAIREKLSRTPTYEALGTVFTNQRAKKLTEANNLIKKLEKGQQSVPAEFLAERDFHSL